MDRMPSVRTENLLLYHFTLMTLHKWDRGMIFPIWISPNFDFFMSVRKITQVGQNGPDGAAVI